jgi:hypothetical protein
MFQKFVIIFTVIVGLVENYGNLKLSFASALAHLPQLGDLTPAAAR